jgi:hypothetical protein
VSELKEATTDPPPTLAHTRSCSRTGRRRAGRPASVLAIRPTEPWSRAFSQSVGTFRTCVPISRLADGAPHAGHR